MKIEFKRSTVIKALKTEPLQAGSFFITGNLANCPVCAVGAVLRTTMGARDLYRAVNNHGGIPHSLGYAATKGAYINANLKKIRTIAQDGNYLGALSCYFERIARNDKRFRRSDLVRFVKTHFPVKFTVEI